MYILIEARDVPQPPTSRQELYSLSLQRHHSLWGGYGQWDRSNYRSLLQSNVCFYRALLQKRPVIESILLNEATPYVVQPLTSPPHTKETDLGRLWFKCKRNLYTLKETYIYEKRPPCMANDLYIGQDICERNVQQRCAKRDL